MNGDASTDGRELRPSAAPDPPTFIACPAVLGELAEGAVDGVDCHKLGAPAACAGCR